MPHRRSQDAALSALAHPRRRQMLALVLDRERSSSELANRCRLSRPAASQHLRVLRETGLVASREEGNRRLYRAQVTRLAEVRAMLDDFWGERLARLSEELTQGER
ncbi:MAG TPA: metalloregulator ArsR/SmtB family transcription factor [Solirubrobacteraceae bacterium]|nr:metalloregulator ArsR/SmtB family transcription factor [Solirubrobacteraceae bacterium]